MAPYGVRDLGQYWLRKWLVAWRHQAITWTNADLSSLRSSDVHMRAISLEISQPSVTKISLKSISLRFYWNLPWANELNVLAPSPIARSVCDRAFSLSVSGVYEKEPPSFESWSLHKRQLATSRSEIISMYQCIGIETAHVNIIIWRFETIYIYIYIYIYLYRDS